jgi:hypothetical protein
MGPPLSRRLRRLYDEARQPQAGSSIASEGLVLRAESSGCMKAPRPTTASSFRPSDRLDGRRFGGRALGARHPPGRVPRRCGIRAVIPVTISHRTRVRCWPRRNHLARDAVHSRSRTTRGLHMDCYARLGVSSRPMLRTCATALVSPAESRSPLQRERSVISSRRYAQTSGRCQPLASGIFVRLSGTPRGHFLPSRRTSTITPPSPRSSIPSSTSWQSSSNRPTVEHARALTKRSPSEDGKRVRNLASTLVRSYETLPSG